MQAEIKNIRLDRIKPNPHRDIDNYPIDREKVDALARSIQSGNVGLWPSIIARPARGGGYEQAFGHHRVEAAEKVGLKTIPIIEMPLSDEDMLMYMARENSEDFGTEFLVSLNTWEAGYNFLVAGKGSFSRGKTEPQAVDIARLFGWVTIRPNDEREVITYVANACSLAFRLIQAGHMERGDFAGLTTRTAREIADRTLSALTTLEKSKELNPSSEFAATVKKRKTQVGKAARKVAKDVRGGNVAPKDVRKATETQIYNDVGIGEKQKPIPPNFDKFCYQIGGEIGRVLKSDGLPAKIENVIDAIPHLELAKDEAAVTYLGGTLAHLSERAEDVRKRLEKAADAPKSRVVNLVSRKGA